MVISLHNDWSIRLGENTPDQTLNHLAAMLYQNMLVDYGAICFSYKKPGSRPITKIVLIFGHILVLRVSCKFLKSMKQSTVITKTERRAL